MSPQTAKFMIHRAGLSVFTIRELRDLLTDPHGTLSSDLRAAIKTILTTR